MKITSYTASQNGQNVKISVVIEHDSLSIPFMATYGGDPGAVSPEALEKRKVAFEETHVDEIAAAFGVEAYYVNIAFDHYARRPPFDQDEEQEQD